MSGPEWFIYAMGFIAGGVVGFAAAIAVVVWQDRR